MKSKYTINKIIANAAIFSSIPPIPDDLKIKYPNHGPPPGYGSPGTTPAKAVQIANQLLSSSNKEEAIIYKDGDDEYLIKREVHFDNHPKLKPGQKEGDPDYPRPYWHPGVSVYKKISKNPIDDFKFQAKPYDENLFTSKENILSSNKKQESELSSKLNTKNLNLGSSESKKLVDIGELKEQYEDYLK